MLSENNCMIKTNRGGVLLKKGKVYFQNNTVSLIILIISIILTLFYYMYFNTTNMNFEAEFSYNLLTVNTVFAGFLYTMLGNMVEFSTRPKIREKDKAGYIDKYFSPIYFGLFFFVISVSIEMLILFFNLDWYLSFLLFISRACSFVGVLYFITSSYMLRRMINQVRK